MNYSPSHQVPEVATFGVLGVSAAMQPVLSSIREAASNGRSVLVCGEAGTGRGRIARAIHALAGSSPEAFLQADCGGAADDGLEVRLFGAESRWRTGRSASDERETLADGSLLWQARGGTLYLANIVDAPSPVQARLARLLRDREAIAPDRTPVRLGCRLIASVGPDFERALADGRLRRDLYTRLATPIITVPPLRDRPEDIPALAAFFLDQYAQSLGVGVKQVSAAATMLLQALPWRGNAWELRGLVETLAQSVPGDTIDLADVLSRVRLDPQARSVAVGGTLRAARRRFEREYIYAVLQQFSGEVPRAARALGIQRTNLYRKMRSLGVTVPRVQSVHRRAE